MSGRSGKKKMSKLSRSSRAGVIFPVGRMMRYLKKGTYKYRIGVGAPVYMAAVIEYLAGKQRAWYWRCWACTVSVGWDGSVLSAYERCGMCRRWLKMLTVMNLLLEEAEDGNSLLQRCDAWSLAGRVASYCYAEWGVAWGSLWEKTT